ncbi:MAG: NTP/NDP exchange transporter [Salinivirgaceae bacterium]
MKEKNSLYKSLNIEANEVVPVLLLIAQSVFLGIFYGTFDIGAHTLFLKTFPEDMIPKAYIISGMVGIVMTAVFSKYQSIIRFSNLAKYTLLFISLLTILIRIFFEFSAAKWTVFLVFILLGPLNILAILAFWGTVSRIFTLRQGKRLFGIIDSGQVFGIIISSYAIPLIITFLNGTKNLLIISSVSIIAAMIFEMIISRRFNLDIETNSPSEIKADEQEQVKLQHFVKNPYILYMALFVIFSMFTAFFVQYSFLVVTNEQYPGEDDLAKFLGFFTGSMMIFTFVIKTFVYSKLMKTYGLKISLMLSSLLLLIFTGLAILVGLISGYQVTSAGFIYFFLLISLSKLFNKTLKDALEVPSFKLLYQSLKKSIRFDVQAKIDGTINEIAALISGLLLGGLGLLAFITLIHFSVFLFLLLAVWSFITVRLYKEYRKSLEESLKEETEPESEESAYRLSEKITSNSNALNHKLSQIKRFTPDRYLAYLDSLYKQSGQIHQGLSKMHRIELLLLEFTKNKSLEKSKYLKLRKDVQIAANAAAHEIAAFLASTDEAHYFTALNYILELEAKPRLNLLLALMRIPMPEVQKISIRLCGTLNDTDSTTTLAEFLDSEHLMPDAMVSLGQLAQASYRVLIQMFYKTDISLTYQLALLDLIGQINTEDTAQFLLENINNHKKEIRQKAISQLKAFNYQVKEKDYPKLYHTITQTAQDVAWDISALASFTGIATESPLFTAIEFEFQNHRNLLMQLLAITYDPRSVQHVSDHLNSDTSEGIGYALELFDLFLAEEIKPFILAIFEDLPYVEKAQLLESFFPIKVYEPNELIIQIINRDPNLISRTTKKIALQEYTNYFQSISDDLAAQIFSPVKELQVLSSQIIQDINPAKFQQLKARIKPQYRRNLESKNITGTYPEQNVLNTYKQTIQKICGVASPLFIEFFDHLSLIPADAIKNKQVNDHLINYFVFLVFDQKEITQVDPIYEIYENYDEIKVAGDVIVGISNEAMTQLMLTQKQTVQQLINLIQD